MRRVLSAALAFWMLTPAWGAAAFDAAKSTAAQAGVTTVTTGSFTIGSGSNRAAIACLAFFSSNNETGITMSVGGVSGSLISGTDTGTGTSSRSLCFCITNPPSGSQTATASWTGSATVDFGVITATGVDQSTPCNNGNSASFTGNHGATLSVTITSNSGDLTTTLGQTENAFAATPTNQTLKWGIDTSNWGGDIGPGTGTTTHSWTDNALNQNMTVSGANFKAAASATPSGNKRSKLDRVDPVL